MQNSLLKLEVDGKSLSVTNFSFSHSLGNSVGSFEADLHTKEFEFLKTRMGKRVEITLGEFKRHCLLEQLSYEPLRELSIGGRDLISIMLDTTAKPKSYADGIMFNCLAKSVCDEFEVRYEGSKDVRLQSCIVNKGETALAFLERVGNPLLLSTETGSDIRVIEDLGKIEIKKGFKLTGAEYVHNISDVFESYKVADSSHSWMPGWDKPKQQKVLGSGPARKKKIFFGEKKDLVREAKTREFEAQSITLKMDRIFNIKPGTILDIDTMGIKGIYKAKSITFEVSSNETSTQIEAGRKN